jgi:hypothetical protein
MLKVLRHNKNHCNLSNLSQSTIVYDVQGLQLMSQNSYFIVDCSVMMSIFLIPNPAAIRLTVFLHVHSFLCEEVSSPNHV